MCEFVYIPCIYFCIQRGLISELARLNEHLIGACAITNVNQNTFSDTNYEKKSFIVFEYFLKMCIAKP